MHERRLTCVELEEESKLMQQNPFEEEKEIPEDSEKAEFYECVDGLQKGLLSLMTSNTHRSFLYYSRLIMI
jgi:hypothetical protein